MKDFKKLRRAWKDCRLQLKLVIVFVLTISLILVINIVLFFNINSMIEQVDNIYVSNIALSSLSEALQGVQESMTEYLDTKSSDALDAYYKSEQEYRHYLDMLNGNVYSNEMLITEKNIKQLSEDYLKLVNNTVSAKRGRDVELYKEYYEIATHKSEIISVFIYSLNNEQFTNNTSKYQMLLSALRYLEIINMAMLISAAFFDIIFIYLLTGNIIKPLQDLSAAATKVAAGDFDTTVVETENSDEVGILSRTFNQMIQSIQQYVLRIRQSMEKESAMKERELMMEGHLKDAQLKYLQAQINPHFLFNTLNAGAQLAMLEDAEKTCLFIENMADFFRYNIKKIDEDTTIGEELRLVDSYIYILNVRFAGEIHYHKQIDEDFNHIKVPSMILQPVVENAVNYGIRGLDREGIIEVSVYKDEPSDCICISIWDNGNGMTAERIEEVMEGRSSETSTTTNSNGIGLGNVMTRLKLYFNTDDVMTIKSDGLDMGTEVTIWIPNEVREDDSDEV